MDLESSIQTMLGLPELNRTETRRNLAKIFALYRRCRIILSMQIIPDTDRLEREAIPGYENAMDPDLVHVPYRVSGGSPSGFSPSRPDHTHEMIAFVKDVHYKVGRLPRLMREIVYRRFLVLDDPLPSDTEVWYSMREDGMAIGTRTYERLKAYALSTLAAAWGVEVEETD
jgi:hypothetical protein